MIEAFGKFRCVVLLFGHLPVIFAFFQTNLPRRSIVRPPILGTTDPIDRIKMPVGANLTELVLGVGRRLPPDVSTDNLTCDTEIVWFLRDRYYDIRRTAEKITSRTRWRRTFGKEMARVSTLREARSRKAYLAPHRDVLGRPVVVAVARRHSILNRRLQESQLYCVEVLEQALAQLPPPITLPIADARDDDSNNPGKPQSSECVTQILGIFDLRSLNPTNLDFEFVTFLINTVYKYYPQRLGQVLLVDPPPFMFEYAWDVIKPALGRHAELVRFVSVQEVRSKYFTYDTLPNDFR